MVVNKRSTELLRKTRRRNKKRLPVIPLFFIASAGTAGFYVTKTAEGIGMGIVAYFVLYIAFKIWLKSLKTRKLRKSGIREVDKMTGEDFERFLGELFKRRGFKVSYTRSEERR